MKEQKHIITINKISLLIVGISIFMHLEVQAQKQNVPLEILKAESKICMKWEVAEKIIPRMFIVEKSTDGIKFEAIGIRETTNERLYTFCDEEPGDKIAMYRIMKVESKNKLWTENMNEVNITQYTNSEQVRLSLNDKNSETGKEEAMLSNR